MKRFTEIVNEHIPEITELFPWDLDAKMQADEDMLLVDIREPYEYDAMHIDGSINVPRGILEAACEYNYEETVPELVQARERQVILICRSGNRSVLGAYMMQLMGYRKVASLKTGLRGWNDYELPMIDSAGGEVDIDDADDYFTPKLRPEQMAPAA
ncbi:MAG: rhodanese-like domain-containing protein [Chromatiales bacterium]|nr:rhodanese-like domain-containing protein [Gammaproteobacteria bacterium]MCP5230967.1 rhodanese-like domain-containing protein [Zoogloeaceae bacterium]MCP5352279.1 rhodanese-like domain-containing protein [Chromatiales bacterium]